MKRLLAVDVDVVDVDLLSYYAYEDENEEQHRYYQPDFPSPSQGFSQFVGHLPRRWEIEMQQYRILMGYMENLEEMKHRNIWRQYDMLSRADELRRIIHS